MIFAIFAGFPTLVEFFGALLCKTFFIRKEKENLVVFKLLKLKHVFLGQEICIRGTRINMWLCLYVRPHFSALPRMLHGFVVFLDISRWDMHKQKMLMVDPQVSQKCCKCLKNQKLHSKNSISHQKRKGEM